MKRGQVALFLIVGMLLVLAVGIVLLFAREPATTPSSPDASSLRRFVEACLEQAGEDAIYGQIALRGGYAFPEGKPGYAQAAGTESPRGYPIAYHLLGGSSVAPSLELVRQESEKLVNEKLDSCLDFSEFEVLGYEVDAGARAVRVAFNEQGTGISLKFPVELSVEGGDSKVTLSDFSAELPARMSKVHQIGQCVVNSLAAGGSKEYAVASCNSDKAIRVVIARSQYALVYDYSGWPTLRYHFAVEMP